MATKRRASPWSKRNKGLGFSTVANRKAILSSADMTRAAKIAKREGCAVTIKICDGQLIEVQMMPAPATPEDGAAAMAKRNAWDD